MKYLRLALVLSTLCATLVHARPVVVEETAVLTPPDSSWTYFGRVGVAIDGDYALVSGERYVPDPGYDGGLRPEGAAFVYQRSGASWTYTGLLGPVQAFNDEIPRGLAMKGGVAMTLFGSARVFERSGSTWTQAPLAASLSSGLEGRDIEIDGGRILVARTGCRYESVVLRKISGTWNIDGEIGGNAHDCMQLPSGQDLQGNRAIMHQPQHLSAEPHRIYVYRPSAAGGWEYEMHAEAGSIDSVFGPEVALNGDTWANTGSRQRGTSVGFRHSSGVWAWSHYGLQPVDSYLQPETFSSIAIERIGTLFVQRNYSFDRKAHVLNAFRVDDNEPVRSSTHLVTFQGRSGTSVGTRLDTSGNRIIVNGRELVSGGHNTVRIFEMPASFDQPAVQVHDFSNPSDAADWQPTAGSTFAIARLGDNYVYRQPSTTGNPMAYLPGSARGNQSIQAEITLRAVSGPDRWIGLLTRRGDDSNYYYVTLRTGGTVQLRRMLDGAFTTLASAPATVITGRKYRLRLESIGTVHRVYLNDRLVLTARDSELAEGTAGIAMNQASADYDNVYVTPSPLTSIYTDNFSNPDLGNWMAGSWQGQWQANGGVYRQAYTGGHARAYIGGISADQVVRARIRPTSFVEPDNWVGLTARYQDAYNHLYVSLRGRGVVSLWRRTDNTIVNLGQRTLAITPGTWYDVRLEVVNDTTRVFVNNQLLITSEADPGPTNPIAYEGMGQVGFITYKATADFDDFVAYQP